MTESLIEAALEDSGTEHWGQVTPASLESSDLSGTMDELRQALQPAHSRNRYFEWYAAPSRQALLGFRRSVDGLLTDLSRAEPQTFIQIHRPPKTTRVQLTLNVARLAMHRNLSLSRAELESLWGHPILAPRLIHCSLGRECQFCRDEIEQK